MTLHRIPPPLADRDDIPPGPAGCLGSGVIFAAILAGLAGWAVARLIIDIALVILS